MPNISLYSRLEGSFLGLAIGDAMGAPLEFMRPYEFEPVTGFTSGGAHNVEAGEWTDDMAMALATSDSLIENKGELVLSHVLDNFLLWHVEGKFSSRGHCFDIGNTCRTAIIQYKRNKEVVAHTKDESQSGNGSLMRMAPILVVFHADYEILKTRCLESSRTTHASPLVDEAVIQFANIIHNILSGKSKDEVLYGYSPNPDAKPTGFVVDSLDVAVIAFRDTNSFKEGLLHVVNQGGDADTIGAIYGQIAGAYYGYEKIPSDWKCNLWQVSMLANVFEKLWAVRSLT